MRRAWLNLRYNGVTSAIHCAIHGHDWHDERPTRCVTLTTCRWCGKFRGSRVVSRRTCAWHREAS